MTKEEREKLIDDILTRNAAEIYPNRKEFEKALRSGKRLRLYNGMDPTAPKLHLGHASILILLEKFRKLGHEVIMLFGDFTGLIGDPTDKTAARVMMTEEQVNENLKDWKRQAQKLLNFSDKENPATIKRNSTWLGKLTFRELIDIASKFTVQQMIQRDMFQKRMENNKPIHLHEFFYPLMQGYDSVAMDVDLEIGASDQTFNMLAGRTLQKALRGKEKFVLATNLLVDDVTGKKLMSKSEGGFVALDDPPREMFGKIMALGDGTIVPILLFCTNVPMERVGEIEKGIKTEKFNPRDAKLELAGEVVKMLHGQKEAEAAREYFVNTFSKGETPEEAREIEVANNTKLADFVAASGEAGSRSEARRKIEQGGVSVEGKKISQWDMPLGKKLDGKIFRIGKKGFYRLKIK